jgi:polysaccharide pyruvyl transferase WcaK-like protein
MELRNSYLRIGLVDSLKDSLREALCRLNTQNSRKMKIGLIGWWRGRNAGDEIILQVLRDAFGKGFDIFPISTSFRIDADVIHRLNTLDFLIVGGGGLFTHTPPEPFDTFEIWEERLTVPFGFLGVGVQEINPGYAETIRQIVERSVFFVVRDIGSFELVRRFSPNVRKAPDLTFLRPLDAVRTRNAGLLGVNLRVWNFDEKRTYDNAAWCRAINSINMGKETIPFSSLNALKDADAMRCIEGRKNRTFNESQYEKIKVMVGMRLHSLIFAVQKGIPVIGISYAPKVRRFFQEIGLEEFCLGVEEYGRLGEVFHKALEREKEISETLARYTESAHGEITRLINTVITEMGKYSKKMTTD